MTEHLLHVRARKGVNGRTPEISGSMMDMERNESLHLTSHEAGKIATVLNGETKPRGERVIYLHQDNAPEKTASGSLVDLKTDQPYPLSPEDAGKIAAIVREIEAIEASSDSKLDKLMRRSSKDPHIGGKPLNRQAI